MPDATRWFLVSGLLLVFMALAGSVLKRLPMSASMFYVAAGIGLGPLALGLLSVEPFEHAAVLERITEVVVLVSLFAAGLKLRVHPSDRRWLLPSRLAFISMTVTVGLVALVGVYALGLPLGAAILLGAVLAPTDPVLASDVQVSDSWDRDKLRFALTGEAGLNDGTAFPFVMLGLGLLGLHDLGEWGWKWATFDLVWGVAAGLACGALLGAGVARLVLYLRRHHREGIGLDDLLAMGLIALAYGAALLIDSYGFLAVFAAGVSLRWVEMRATGERPPEEVKALAAHGNAADPDAAPAFMAEAVLGFTGQMERVAEVVVVVLLGSMLTFSTFGGPAWWFVPALFLVIRPLSAWFGLLGSPTSPLQRRLIGWFGVRGVGSVYYLAYALTHGLTGPAAQLIVNLVFATVAMSVVAHGLSVTPLMNMYRRAKRARANAGPTPRTA